MLAELRGASKGWIAGIFIALLIAAFAIWGIEDIFRTRVSSTVAEVGETRIEAQNFVVEFERLSQRLGQNQGEPLSREQALQFGLDQVALNQMISRVVLDQKAQELGLTVSDTAVDKEIIENPAFHGPTGDFDARIFRELLARNRMTPAMFDQAMREDMTRLQLVDAIQSGIEAPREYARAIYQLQAERRQVSYLLVPATAVADPGTPEDSTLQALHEQETFRFTAPEYRSFTYLLLRPEDLTATIDVAEQDLQDLYEQRRDSYVEPERRSVRQIVFNTADEAQTARERLLSGETFETIATERELTPQDTELGTLAQAQFIDPAVGMAAFALAEPGVAEPVEGAFGVTLIQVDTIEAGSTQAFEEVRDQLRDELALGEAQNAIYDLIERIEDERAGGLGLQDVASQMDLTLITVTGADRRGLNAAGEAAGPDSIPPSALKQAFESDVGLENSFEEAAGGAWLVTEVTDVTPSQLRPFETVREDVLALWRERQQAAALAELGAQLVASVESGDSLEALADPLSARVVTPVAPIERGAIDPTLTEALVRDLFRARPGAVLHGPAQGGGAHVVARVEEIVTANETEGLFPIAQLETALQQSLEEDLAEQFVVTLRDEVGVEINQQAVNFALGQSISGQ